MSKTPDSPNDAAGTATRRNRSLQTSPADSAKEQDAELNSIEFRLRAPAQPSSGGSNGLRMSKKRGAGEDERPKNGEARESESLASKRAEPVPDSVRDRFIQIGNNFFFPDGAKAFTDRGDRLTTHSENTVVIQSMVAIARDRAAGELTIKGTEFFRREAWFAAKLSGIEVKGYEPTALEQERLVRAIARRQQSGGERSLDSTPAGKSPDHKDTGAASSGKDSQDRASPSKDEEFIFGRLVEHGPDRFKHNDKNAMNYYVLLETEQGDVERWGVDLERAFRQSLSRPGIGEEVGIRVIGRDAVTVPKAKRDKEGREIGREELHTHRNQWMVERKDFLERRQEMADAFRDPHMTVGEAAKRFPELEGSALQFRMGEALAEQQYKNARHREQFVNHLREYLAKMIESGKPLEPVPLRDRSRPEQVKDRDPIPTR